MLHTILEEMKRATVKIELDTHTIAPLIGTC
jgi:hypothetical protein